MIFIFLHNTKYFWQLYAADIIIAYAIEIYR